MIHLLRSFRFAFAGVFYLVRTQPTARVHLLATLCVIVAGARLGVTPLEWTALVLAIGTVWTAEMFNTALELLADASVPHIHELVRRSKDIAAGAVLIASLAAALIGAFVFIPYL